AVVGDEPASDDALDNRGDRPCPPPEHNKCADETGSRQRAGHDPTAARRTAEASAPDEDGGGNYRNGKRKQWPTRPGEQRCDDRGGRNKQIEPGAAIFTTQQPTRGDPAERQESVRQDDRPDIRSRRTV